MVNIEDYEKQNKVKLITNDNEHMNIDGVLVKMWYFLVGKSVNHIVTVNGYIVYYDKSSKDTKAKEVYDTIPEILKVLKLE